MGWVRDRMVGKPRGTAGQPPIPAPGFAVLDLETTGLSPQAHRVVQIAVIQTDPMGGVQTEWSTLVNPGGPVGATHIHGITEADVRDAPGFADVAGEVMQRLRGRALVAHNARFDLAFLAYELGRAGWAWPVPPALCTMQHAGYYLPDLPRNTLASCCQASGIALRGAHSALGDARATTELLRCYLDPRRGRVPLSEHTGLPRMALGVSWPPAPGVEAPHARIWVAQPRAPRASARSYAAKPTARRMAPMLAEITLRDLSAAGAPTTSLEYLELLLQALSDGELTEEERDALADVAEAVGLGDEDQTAAHAALCSALADRAVDDGVIATIERTEIKQIMELIGQDSKAVTKILNAAKERRWQRLSQNLPPLPAEWGLGDPLRVGDSIAFTGDLDGRREALEAGAKKAGVAVGSVSRKTRLLVADGNSQLGKYAQALDLGTPIVHPSDFEVLLRWIQPHGT